MAPAIDTPHDDLTGLLERLSRSAFPEERRAAADGLGEVLAAHRERLEAGPIRATHLLGALTQRALVDPDAGAAIACVHAAATFFDPHVHAAIARALREGEEPPHRHRAAMVMVEYLDALARNEGGAAAIPRAAFEPLVDIVELPDDDLARHAAERLFSERTAAEAWIDVCERWLLEKRLGRLERLADRVIALAPAQPTGWWRRGQVREVLGDVEGALADYGEVLARAPGFLEARERRAVIRVEGGEFEAAAEELQAIAAADPRSFTAHHVGSLCLYNLGRYADAEAAASRAIDLHPDVGEAWFFRAVARYAADRPDEALADLRKAVELAPDDERAVSFLAELEAWLAVRR